MFDSSKEPKCDVTSLWLCYRHNILILKRCTARLHRASMATLNNWSKGVDFIVNLLESNQYQYGMKCMLAHTYVSLVRVCYENRVSSLVGCVIFCVCCVCSDWFYR